MESGSRSRDYRDNVSRRTDGRETIIYEEEFIVDESRKRGRDMDRIVVDDMSGIDGAKTRNVPNLISGVSNSRSFTNCSGVMDSATVKQSDTSMEAELVLVRNLDLTQ